jgi:hypothetical protein
MMGVGRAVATVALVLMRSWQPFWHVRPSPTKAPATSASDSTTKSTHVMFLGMRN